MPGPVGAAEVTDSAPHLLVVEDDPRLSALLGQELALAGYRVTSVALGGEALFEAEEVLFDLILLDLNLPDMDGLEVAERLRERSPILMVTARADVDSRVAGLYAGASDYLVKPFSVHELLARVHARLRDSAPPAVLRYGELEFDDAANALIDPAGVRATLPELEYRLLALLVRYRGRVFSRNELERHLYGAEVPDSNTVEVFVHNLRKQLAALGVPAAIATVRNKGYLVR